MLTRGSESARESAEARLREEGFDSILDDPRTLNALLAVDGGFSTAPQSLVFYVLVRHALLEHGISDRLMADYLSALLIDFARGKRAYRVEEKDDAEYVYLVDLITAAEAAAGHHRFLLHAHLGDFALWLSGLFPDYITARVQRRGAPGIQYYENLGANGYRLAADSKDAARNGMNQVYLNCADAFSDLRIALNTISDRHLFPTRAESVGRLLRQVSDAFNFDNN